MKGNRLSLCFISILSIMIFAFVLPNYALSYNTGIGGHGGFADKAIQLKKTKTPELKNDLKEHERAIIQSTTNEDAIITSEIIPRWMHHFYNPTTRKGLPYFKNARERANDFYKSAVNSYCAGNKQKGWEKLGHALHLLQDMGSPSHVGDATHAFQQFFPTWGFENYISNNWERLDKQIVAEDCELSGGINDYIQKMSSYTYSSYNRYDKELLTPFPISLDSVPISSTPPLFYTPLPVTKNEDPYPNGPYNTTALLNKITCYSAGLIDTFWNDVYADKCSPKLSALPPGGDHPDETYDVSIPLQYDINEADYQWINMRLAMEKGRIGYYWAYLYGNKYQEIYSLPSDTTVETIGQKFVELKNIEDLLSNYHSNEIEDIKSATDVAVLSNGYAEEIIRLLFKEKETARLIEAQFSVDDLKNQPVLVIPSGGLYGLENSTFFKASLDEFVKNGGTLIVFAQQHGYEFSILPAPQEADGTFKQVTGYGWTEDQSCFTNAAYIDTWHQILAGQSRSTPTLNIDGYFTNYPSNATVFLRRTANGQPAMLMYDYGMGKVVVTSMYSDWAYGHSQASNEEIALLRDMISWAKKPDQLPEVKPGETVSVLGEVTNNTITDAASVKYLIYNPDRTTLLSEQTISISIPAGQSAIIPVSYQTTSNSSLGIYHIDYALLDSAGNVIQPQAETDSGRFVVSKPPVSIKGPDLNFAVNSDSENYAYGSDAVFTATIWNNTDTEKSVTASYYAYHLNVTGSPKMMIVPAHSSASFKVIASNITWQGWLVVKFYDENNRYITERWKGIWMFYPSLSIDTRTDKSLYSRGDTVNLNLNLQNKNNAGYTATIKVKVSDPTNTNIYSTTLIPSLAANATMTRTVSFLMPQTAQGGFYTVSVEAYDSNGKKIGGDSASFELPLSLISISPQLPTTLSSGANTISSTLNNAGKISVSTGTLDVSLKDPDGAVIYTGSQPFTIASGESKILDVPISIPALKFGTYSLTYTQSDETRTGSPTTITIPNTATIALSLDKYSYRIRETANLTATITNTGKFNQGNVSMTLRVPDVNYTEETKTISLAPCAAYELTVSLIIPATILTGQHNVVVILKLPSGSSIVQSSKLTIPESSLEIASPSLAMTGQTTLTAGDVINLTIENTGGVDTTYTTEKLTITDNRGVVIYQGNVTGTVLAGEEKSLVDVQIPSQAACGFVLFSLQVKDNKTLKMSYLYRTLEITGLSATLQTRTDKPAYLKTETITGISKISNGTFGIESGSLKVTVSKIKPIGGWQFTRWGSYGSSDGQFKTPYGIAVDDKYVYVADYYNHRIQIFDKSTNAFVGKFGSYGGGNGQFCNPQGIAVDDRYIYVGDIYGYRVQVFNKFTYAFEGVFGRGQVVYPYGIAVDDKYIYVADQYRLHAFDKFTYSLKTSFGGGFNHPYKIAVDDSRIYATDVYNHRVQVYDKFSYAFMRSFGSYGTMDGQFSYAWDVAVDNSYIYVTDFGGRLQIFEKDTYAFVERIMPPDNSSLAGSIAVDSSAIYLANIGNYIQKIVRGLGGSDKLFETTIPIDQPANTTQDYTTNIGTLNATGKLYLQAELKNSIGQTIAKSEYPFYIIEGNTILLFSTDKKIYTPGETVTITGEVKNLATITASALSLQLSANSQNIYTATFDVPANSSYPFTITTVAGTEGIYTLTGKVTQNNSTLVEITDQYEVVKPKVSATVSVPEVVGNEPFNINLEMKNEGKITATIDAGFMMQDTTTDNQTIRISSGETKLKQYTQQITNDTTYTFTFTGDLNQTITKAVSYGLSSSIAVNPLPIYPEGKIGIPVTITNTGQLDITIDTRCRMQDSSNNIIQEMTRSYYIPKGGNLTDTLYFDLLEGSYQLTAISNQPSATASASFSVRKENKVNMTLSIGSRTNELIPITVNLTNLGYNSIEGNLLYTIISTQGTAIWNGEQAVSLPSNPPSPIPNPYLFNINSSSIQPGKYTLKVELLSGSNQQLAVSTQLLTISGPIFQITQLPPYQTFYVGQEATFTFKIKNTGNQEGAFDFNLKAYDLIDSTQREWLKPGEEKSITFSFMLPEDLEEKDYFVDYRLGDSPDSTVLQAGKSGTVPTRGQVKYHIEGINLDVNATLDKQYYKEGDDARLTIPVSTRNPQLPTLNLFARVNYNGYESQQTFTLSGSQTLTFDIPLTQITGEKLFYGIYHESGRSIHLNSLYIYKAGDVITITTDKQVYNPGGTVSVAVNSVSGITNGTMTLSGPNYTETIAFTGTATRSFILPATMTAGTYNISCQLSAVGGETYTANHPIDVAGIQVKVLECKNDKGKYASSDTITANFTISSNKAMPAILKAWIVDPEGKYISVGENSINLSSSDPLLFTDHYSLTTAVSGIHRLVYGIYSGDLLLVSGSEAFDVGDAVLLGISTDKTDYPTNAEPVNVKVSMYGTVDANLELQLDRTTVETQSVSLNGFTTLDIELGIMKPGTHVLKGILTSGGLRSTKETSFVYGSSLPDLAAGVRSQDTKVRNDNTIKIVATVTNQGKTPSNTTTIALYDGDPELVSGLIETKPINALNSGESQEITIIWNVLGKAGEHTIKAIADPDNSVIEFNEDNNAATTNILIPDIILITETDKGTYKIRQKVNITSTITNLTSAKTYNNFILFTSAKNPAGTEVYQNSTMIDILQPSSSTQRTETWNTSGLPVDGVYTITQTVISDPQLLAQSSKLIALEKAPDFTIRTDKDYQKIKQGEKATYTVYIEPLNGWNSEVSLGIEGLPEGTSVSFSPGNPIPPGDVLIAIITTDTTPAGTHTLNLIAEGIDEGEVITHTLPLTTDASGFGLEVDPSSQAIQQLEGATFNISLLSMNEYEGEINLSIDGLPYGVNASFEKSTSHVPGNVKLTVQTSKYVRPGTYTFTITGDDGLVEHTIEITLNINANPEIASGIISTQGPGPNNEAWVRLFNSTIQPVFDLIAFDTKYGANVTSADIDGDGYDEIVVSQGPGPKNTATLRVFKRNGTTVTEYTAFDSKYGLTISSADLNGDWLDELIVGMGPDPKNPAQLRILKYNGNGFTEIMTQTVYIDLKYGLNTATGDIDGDGLLEIIAAPGPGPNNPAVITVWKDTGGYLTELYTFTAFEGNYGANISTGDIDGDRKAEIITGTGPDPKNPSIVRVFKSDGSLMLELRPYDNKYGYGVTVASTDLDGDGIDEIITGLGFSPQNPAWVKVFKADGTEAANFLAYPENIGYGVKVSTGKTGE